MAGFYYEVFSMLFGGTFANDAAQWIDRLLMKIKEVFSAGLISVSLDIFAGIAIVLLLIFALIHLGQIASEMKLTFELLLKEVGMLFVAIAILLCLNPLTMFVVDLCSATYSLTAAQLPDATTGSNANGYIFIFADEIVVPDSIGSDAEAIGTTSYKDANGEWVTPDVSTVDDADSEEDASSKEKERLVICIDALCSSATWDDFYEKVNKEGGYLMRDFVNVVPGEQDALLEDIMTTFSDNIFVDKWPSWTEVGAAFENKYDIWTAFGGHIGLTIKCFLPWLVSWLAKLIIFFTITANVLMIIARAILMPIGIVQLFDGEASNGIHYLKRFIAELLQMTIIVIALAACSILASAIAKTQIANHLMYRDHIILGFSSFDDLVSVKLVFVMLVPQIAAIGAVTNVNKITRNLLNTY